MNFPVTMNEPEFHRLIEAIAEVVVKKVRPREYKPFLSLNDCYAIAQSEKLVLTAIKNGNLKLTVKEGRQVVKRSDFIKWLDN